MPLVLQTTAEMLPDDAARIVHYLTYCCYAYNRRRSPAITPERWRLVFGDQTDRLEERFQKEAHGEPR